jgi:spore coat protein U-like protein
MRLAVIGATLVWGLLPLGSLRLQAAAIPTTASFAVNASVVSGCWIVGNPTLTSGVAFGTLDFGSHPAMQAGNYNAAISLAGNPIQIQCTPSLAVSMTIDGGQNALGNQRRMRFGSYFIPYTLSTQAGGGVLMQPNVAISINVSAGPAVLPVYGRASPSGSGVPGGQYTDTLQVLISW